VKAKIRRVVKNFILACLRVFPSDPVEIKCDAIATDQKAQKNNNEGRKPEIRIQTPKIEKTRQ